MRPVRISDLTPSQLRELDALYRTTRNVRLQARAQMILLAAEQRLTAAEIAPIVRVDQETVRRWLNRYRSEGTEGLRDAPRPGAPIKVTAAYIEQLLAAVRRRPRSLELPFSLWTLRRLADYLAEQTGIRVAHETVRLYLKAAGIVLRRPQHTITSSDPCLDPSAQASARNRRTPRRPLGEVSDGHDLCGLGQCHDPGR